jgi:hypothetical protein
VCDGQCLEQKKICDFKVDCLSDGSDEVNCRYNNEGNRVYVPPSQTTSNVIRLTTASPQQSGSYVAYPLQTVNKEVRKPFDCFRVVQRPSSFAGQLPDRRLPLHQHLAVHPQEQGMQLCRRLHRRVRRAQMRLCRLHGETESSTGLRRIS